MSQSSRATQTNLIGHITSFGHPIPIDLRFAFAPASHYLYEWKEYFVECPGADRLRLGTEWIEPVASNTSWFRLRFENRLGLTTIQPFAGSHSLCPPACVEVISRKFPEPVRHLAFFRGLLDDLFARATRLPFAFSGATGRGVAETLRPPTPLFTLHFLCQYRPALNAALSIIQGAPHRQLCDDPAFVSLAEASEADADVLLSVLHAPDEWVPARGFALAERLRGHAPVRVWQRRSNESYDTPENRFVLAFLREILVAAEALPSQNWWKTVPPERQIIVQEMFSLLRQSIAHPMFDQVGPMHRLPLSSQVLLRRDGYRDLLVLWQVFHQARRPLFESLEQAIEVRDIATLYETWAFFALVEEIAVVANESPVIDLRLSDESGLRWRAEARFGPDRKLAYNQQLAGYSIPLRPDFTWTVDSQPTVVLDAKFRLEHRFFDGRPDDDAPESIARRADLYKMHTYRDALVGVRAAVAIYPGDESIFYDRIRGPCANVTLADVLSEGRIGVGALAMKPFSE